MKFIKTLSIFTVAISCFFTSCKDDDDFEYIPAVASAINSNIAIKLSDENGAATQIGKYEDKIRVYCSSSRKENEYICEESDSVLILNVDLPNSTDMKYSEPDAQNIIIGKSTTKVDIYFKNQVISLDCYFVMKTVSVNEPYYGNSSIYIEKIEFDGIEMQEKTQVGNPMLCLKLENGKYILKK